MWDTEASRLALIPLAVSKASLTLDCRIEVGKKSQGLRQVRNSRKS
jgi:hypothetical protein